jgi:hypothetical protein
MTRNQWTLTVILAVQVLLVLLVRGPMAGDMGPAEARPLFPPLEAFAPAKLEIQGAGDEKITLTRDGDVWGIDEAEGYPVQDDKVEQLVEKLKEVQVRRPIVTSSRYHAALKVTDDEHERRVRIWNDSSGEPEIDFFVGSSPNYQRTHVRNAGEDLVYAAQGVGAYDVQAEATSWFRGSFVDVKIGNIKSFLLQNNQGAFELQRAEDGTWSVSSPVGMQDRVLDTTKVETLVRAVASLRAAEPAGRRDDETQGLSSPRATAVLRYAEPGGEVGAEVEEELTLWVGGAPADDESRAYVARSGFEFAAEVYKTAVDKLLEQTVNGLEPDTPGT